MIALKEIAACAQKQFVTLLTVNTASCKWLHSAFQGCTISFVYVDTNNRNKSLIIFSKNASSSYNQPDKWSETARF